MSYFFHSQPLLFCLSPGVGGVHIDMIRNISGTTYSVYARQVPWVGTGPFYTADNLPAKDYGTSAGTYLNKGIGFAASRVVPVGAANKPRAWGALACCFLGTPA